MQPRVLLLSLADPTGRFGLARDQRAVEAMGATAVPIPTGVLLSPDPASPRIVPQAPRVLAAMVDEALREPADGMLIGPLPRARQIRAVAGVLGRSLPETLVLCPFLPGLAAAPQLGRFGKREFLRRLVREATVVVVREPEVAHLLDARAADVDLVRTSATAIQKRGPMATWVIGEHHGRGLDVVATSSSTGVLDYPNATGSTNAGCEPAALAALLARGHVLDESIEKAHRYARGLDGNALLIPA